MFQELLALEEQIGNVSTGLSEEKILGSMEHRKYEPFGFSSNFEPCCICQVNISNVFTHFFFIDYITQMPETYLKALFVPTFKFLV